MDDLFNQDVVCSIMDYLKNEYIFIGLVNRNSYNFFKNNENTCTSVSSCFESVPKLEWSGILKDKDINVEQCVYHSKSKEVIEYAESKKVVHSINSVLEHAIRRKDMDMIDWMESRSEMHGPACMIAAVESGSMDMVKRFCVDNLLHYDADNFFPDGAHLYNLSMGDKIIVCEQWKEYVGDYLIESAKDNGLFEILKWLHSQGIPNPNEFPGLVGNAAIYGSEEMVIWMLKNGYRMNFSHSSFEEGIRQGVYMRWLRNANS